MAEDFINQPLTAEQSYALGDIVKNGRFIDMGDRTYLMVQVSPMMVDFLKAIRLQNAKNNLPQSNLAVRDISPFPEENINSSQNSISVEELIKRYSKLHVVNQSLGVIDCYRVVFSMMTEILGCEKKIRSISRKDIIKLRDIYVNLPKHYPRRYRNMSMAVAAEHAKRNGLEKRKHISTNIVLNRLTRVFAWAEKEWLIDRNPAENIGLTKNYAKHQLKRGPFSINQLNIMFQAPLYTGCLDDEKNYKQVGSNRPRRGRFWVPLIGLYTGMRLGEICQLDAADIRKVSGIDCIFISKNDFKGDPNKKVKTKGSERFIPIHEKLIKIGFPEYVKSMVKNGHLKLFPEIKLSLRGGYSTPFSSWFNRRFLTDLGIYRPETTFHSFRHNFRDALREENVPMEAVRVLGGWGVPGGTVENIYGGGLTAEALNRELQKVKYPGLDLSHLYV